MRLRTANSQVPVSSNLTDTAASRAWCRHQTRVDDEPVGRVLGDEPAGGHRAEQPSVFVMPRPPQLRLEGRGEPNG